MEIPVGFGKKLLVDDEDWEYLQDADWHLTMNGYASTVLRNGKSLLMHRIIMLTPKSMVCDHINRNKLDNRRSNLRNCYQWQNRANSIKMINGVTSKYKGVRWRPDAEKYHCSIQARGIRYNLGYFQNELEAAKAYNKKALEIFGEFALLNEVTN